MFFHRLQQGMVKNGPGFLVDVVRPKPGQIVSSDKIAELFMKPLDARLDA